MTERRMPSTARSVPERGRGLRAALAEFMFGMTGYEFARQAVETRAAMENVFLAVVVGDLVGLPIIPPYYALGLLPYVVPSVETWKRRVLRERELSDTHEFHLHGV